MQENVDLNKIHKLNYDTFENNHFNKINSEGRKEEKIFIQEENLDDVNHNKKEIKNENIFSSNFKVLGKLLLVNSLFLIFNNAQLSIILTFVNKKYPKDEILTNAIGIINTVMNILIYPFILGVASTLEILGSQSYGLRNYRLFSYYLSNLRFIGNCFVVLMSFLIYFLHQNIFKAWKIIPEVQTEAIKLILVRFFSVLFEVEIYFKLRYLQIINKSGDALYIITINGFLLPVFAYTFIFLLDIYTHGCGFVYLFNNFFLLISLMIYISYKDIKEKNLVDFHNDKNCLRNITIQQDLFEINSFENNLSQEGFILDRKTKDNPSYNNINSETKFKNVKNDTEEKHEVFEIAENENIKDCLYENNNNLNQFHNSKEEECFLTLFIFIIPLFLISLMDNLSVESMSIYANYFEPNEYSEFLNAYSLYGLVGTISVSFNTSASIMISSNFGIYSSKLMKKLFDNILTIGFIISIILGSLLFLLSETILKILLQTVEISENTRSMFHLSIMCNMIDIVLYILLSALKSFGFIYLGLSIYFVGNIMNVLLIYFFAFKTDMKILGIFFGYFINEIVTISMYSFLFFFFVNFKKIKNYSIKN